MRLRSRWSLTLAWLLSSSMTGASQDLSGPVLGYIWSPESHALRPLQGIPGSATLGDPIELGFPVFLAVTLDEKRFLVSRGASRPFVLLDMGADPASVAILAALPSEFSLAVASRQGSAAALYDASDHRVRVMSDLRTNPEAPSVVDVPVSGGVSRMAVRDDGRLLVYALSGNGKVSVFVWSPESGNRLMTIADSVSDIEFSRSGDVVVSDSVANEVFFLRRPDGVGQRVFLAGEGSGVSDPVAVTVTDLDRIYVANAGTSSVTVLEPGGRVLGVERCGCEVTGLDPVGNSLYRLGQGLGGTVYLLETAAGGDRIVFAPVLGDSGP